MTTGQSRAHFSIPSIIAIAAAIATFFTRPGEGVILAFVAVVCGAIGVLLSMAPSVRGGFVSLLSLILGALGIVVALIRAILSSF